MTSSAAMREFLAQPALAVVGLSRGGRKFGNLAYRDLKKKGYRLYAVHPRADVLEGDAVFRDLHSLPEPVGGVLIVVPPEQAQAVVEQAGAAGIRRVWLQQGAESPEVLRRCRELGLQTIHGECILMFAQPAGFVHRAHRWAWSALGRIPQ
jgi:hypothetical protein